MINEVLNRWMTASGFESKKKFAAMATVQTTCLLRALREKVDDGSGSTARPYLVVRGGEAVCSGALQKDNQVATKRYAISNACWAG
jgi:hypothetical protein